MITKELNTKNLILAGLIIALCVISFFVGNQRVETKEGYEYIKSERLDSLDRADEMKTYRIDSVSGELRDLKKRIEGTNFTTQEEINKIIGNEKDELYNKTPDRIDTLFIIGYDSAVSARRFIYYGH